MQHTSLHHVRLLALAFCLGGLAPAGAQNTVFVRNGVLSRFSGSVFGSGIEPVPIAPQDQAAMQDVYRACRQISVQTSIYNQILSGGCGQSSDERAVAVAGVLPPGWRVDKVQSQDATNIAGGTGHVFLMLTSPDGNTYGLDTYLGVVEIAAMEKQTGFRWNPKSGEEIAGLNATMAVGNFSGTVTYTGDCHYVITDRGVEKYQWDYGVWTPVNRGDWYTPRIIGQPDPPTTEEGSPGSVQVVGEDTQPVQVVRSVDPNELLGPSGEGPQRHVAAGVTLGYQISFENLPAATAPAAEVVVTNVLDPARYDLTTFRLGQITIGSRTLTPPEGVSDWATVVDLRPDQALLLQVTVRLDPATGVASWRFTSLDPATGELPGSADVGFLPPNTTPPAGEGKLTYTVAPVAGLGTGTTLPNQARIVFDANDPIDTAVWTNTIDAGAPTSRVQPVTDAANGNLRVTWAGTDDDQGSGVATYAIFVSQDGGDWLPWLPSTAATAAVYQGQYGRSYRFSSVATDAVGNVEGRVDEQGQPPADTTARTGAPLVLPAGLSFIGLPLLPDQTDPVTLFSFANNRWARWSTAQGAYVRYPDPAAMIDSSRPGQAFWLALDEGRSVSLAGRMFDRKTAVAIPLAAGWNAIASPYLNEVAWDRARVRVRREEQELTLAEAAAAGWVDDYAWGWQTQWGTYGIVYDASLLAGVQSTLQPWRGYWFRAQVACSLVLPVPAGELEPASRRRDGAGWLATVLVASGDDCRQVYFGWSPGRAVQVSEPPAPPSGQGALRAVFVRDDRALAVDAPQPGAAGWELALTAPAGREVVISWPSFLRQLPAGLTAELSDPTAGATVVLNTRAAYRCRLSEGETRRLRLTVRRGAPERSTITRLSVQANRAAGASLTLTLSGPAAVDVVVRGAGGQVVRHLAGPRQAAGTVTVAWDGLDAAGRQVPPGTYVVEATAQAANGTLSRAVRVVVVR